MPQKNSRRPTVLLVIGAGVGVVLAAAGLLSARGNAAGAVPADVVARVNGEVIRLEDYQRVVTTLAQDSRNAVDDAQRRQVLDRLIDEELLVQRGLELGMARHDSKVRKDLTAAVIDSVIADSADAQPSDDELQRFYDERKDFFAAPGRVRLRQIFCRIAAGADAAPILQRAQEAMRRLQAGEDFAAVRHDIGDPELAPLPDTLLPAAKLVDYIGPTAVRTVLSLGVGAVSEPVRSNTGVHVFQVLERQPDTSRTLDDIKPHVLAEFRRRASEHALRAYLDDLRSRAQITAVPQLP